MLCLSSFQTTYNLFHLYYKFPLPPPDKARNRSRSVSAPPGSKWREGFLKRSASTPLGGSLDRHRITRQDEVEGEDFQEGNDSSWSYSRNVSGGSSDETDHNSGDVTPTEDGDDETDGGFLPGGNDDEDDADTTSPQSDTDDNECFGTAQCIPDVCVWLSWCRRPCTRPV